MTSRTRTAFCKACPAPSPLPSRSSPAHCATWWATPTSCAGSPTPSKTNRRCPQSRSRLSRNASSRWSRAARRRSPSRRELHPLLSRAMLDSERDLIANTVRVVRTTRGFRAPQRDAVERCVRIMSHGMAEFQRNATVEGLDDLSHLDRYCYHVAGVVGEMLTELLCDYSAEIGERRRELLKLSVSFGQGLQMTNILKDVWDDRRRGACWLPNDVFRAAGFELETLPTGHTGPEFDQGPAGARGDRPPPPRQRIALHPSHSPPRGGRAPVLPVGVGNGGAHPAPDPRAAGVHRRPGSEDLTARRARDGPRHQCAGPLGPGAQAPLRDTDPPASRYRSRRGTSFQPEGGVGRGHPGPPVASKAPRTTLPRRAAREEVSG